MEYIMNLRKLKPFFELLTENIFLFVVGNNAKSALK